MINNLKGMSASVQDAEVLVIGAGTVGLMISVELAKRGIKVICLESGGYEQISEEHALNKTEQSGMIYAGAEHGRFRCIGGSSTRWGGALIPFQAADMNPKLWPISWQDLSPWLEKVENLFDLPSGPYDEPDLMHETSHLARLAKWPAFRNRNVYSLLHADANAEDGPKIWLNATVTDFHVENGELSNVTAYALDGSSITVRSKEVIIAAGAVESTRILHLIDKQSEGKVSSVSPLLGTGFQDHLSAVVAKVNVKHRKALNRIIGFRFSKGGGMRNMRFELSPETDFRNKMPASFAHVGFTESRGGFSALRDIFRGIQRRDLKTTVKSIPSLIKGMPWLLRAIWWRFVEKRLLFPSDSEIQLHMVIEQDRDAPHRIGLSLNETDIFGKPLARIEWCVTESDIESMKVATELIKESWTCSSLSELATLECRNIDDIALDMASGGGIYHPSGSTRMGFGPENGVVDRDLRLFSLPNVSVCATSVLPTGGGANPTMMLMLLGMRCAERISNQLK